MILTGRQIVGPGIAGNQGRGRGFPNDVELAVRFDFTDEHRFCDVVVRQKRGSSSRQVWSCRARKRRKHLFNIDRSSLRDRLHPHIEANVVRFHGVVGGSLRILDVGVPLVDERFVRRQC